MAKRSRTTAKRKARRRGRVGSLRRSGKPPSRRQTTRCCGTVKRRPTSASSPSRRIRDAIAPLQPAVRRAPKSRRAVRALLAPPLTTNRAQVASRRLTALEHARASSRVEQGGPVRALAVTGVAPGGVPPPPVPPMAGVSNWVPLGPTAIPKGQTYGGPRVLVTGRVTSIAIDPTNHNIIYVGTAQGGVWKINRWGHAVDATDDNEASLAIGAVAMDPSNHLTIYVGHRGR